MPLTTQVDETFERRQSQYDQSTGQLTHYLVYRVTFGGDGAGAQGTAGAIIAAGIPGPGTGFVNTDESVAYLSSIDCQPQQGDDRTFEVRCGFKTLNPSAPDDNPLNQPPGFSWTYNEATENYFVDNSTDSDTNAAGQTGPFNTVNSAGEAFEQFLTRDSGMLIITMTRAEATNNAAANDAYKNTVNQNAVSLDGTSFGAGILKLSPIGAVKSYKTLRDGTSLTYYQKTYTLKCRTEGWDDQPLDVGFNELIGSTTNNTQQLRRIIDGNGNPVTKPWPLDGSGKKKPNATDQPAVLTFKPYKKLDWSALNFA